MFVPSDLPRLAHPNDPGGRAPGHPRNQQRSPVPNQGHPTGLTKNQRKANTDRSFPSNQPIRHPLRYSLFCAVLYKTLTDRSGS